MFPWKLASQPGLVVRPATRRDLDAIADLWCELMTFHAELDDRFGIPPNGRAHYVTHLTNALRDGNYRVIVAQDDGRVIGFVSGYVAQNPPIFPQPRYGFIADICVTRENRRAGVGEQLVSAICDWFRARGMTSIQLNAAHHNPVSQAFWRKMGCTEYISHLWLELERVGSQENTPAPEP